MGGPGRHGIRSRGPLSRRVCTGAQYIVMKTPEPNAHQTPAPPAQALLSQALGLQAAGRAEQAIEAFLGVLAAEPNNVVALYSLTKSLSSLGRYEAALQCIDAAIEANCGFAPSYLARSLILTNLGRLAEALADAKTAILIDPLTSGLLSHWFQLKISSQGTGSPGPPIGDVLEQANFLMETGQTSQAIAFYTNSLTLCDPVYIHAILFNIGFLHNQNKAPDLAEKYMLAAIELKPDFFEAHTSLGSILENVRRFEDALARWRLALDNDAIKLPAHLEQRLRLLNNIGRLKETLRDYAGAEAALHESLLLDIHQAPVLHHWVHLRQKQCKWPVVQGLPTDMTNVLEHASPLAMLGMTDDPAQQRRAAERFVTNKVGTFERMVPVSTRYGHDRIRIGYISSDLSMHAVSLLTVELFETHDRERFEVHAFCWSKEDGTAFRERVRRSFDHFHKIGDLDDEAVADLISKLEIDVLVDLQGLTGNARPNIVARGPAPVQIAYLGYPGTSALPYVDYIVADRFIFPPELGEHFTEKPLYVETGFQVSDSQRVFGPRPTRASFGLPEDAFVFCAFNNSYKITEPMFDCWLRVLNACPNSVLWLLEDNVWARNNLVALAERRGVDARRLYFAGRIDPKDYLARFQVADLFLDTTPYNAGTTANDALWAGLPILTLSGRTYVSRMAGSLLTSAGLSQFVCHSMEAYEAKAIHLCKHPREVASASAALAQRKSQGWLFSTSNFCARFEGKINELVKG